MRWTIAKALIVLALIGGAWAAGRAQVPVADFEISINAPGGSVVMTCHRGCDWMTLESDQRDMQTGQVIPNSAGPQKFFYGCGGPRCGAAVNGRGFVRR